MPKIRKKQSFNHHKIPNLPERPLPARTFLYTAAIFFIYIGIPASLAIFLKNLPLKFLIVFYLVNSLVLLYFLKRNLKLAHRLKLNIQDLEEGENILNDRNLQEIKYGESLKDRIRRYISLKEIIEKINQDLSLDYIADKLSDIAFSFIGQDRGVCILYLVDNATHRLKLFKARKEDKDMVIKTKEGDIFDLWVLRHASPLLIEDVRKDFRFDLEKLKSMDARNFLSLMSSPFVSENRFLGIIRLDNPIAGFYSQDDLRLLAAISDIGAVALENGEFFNKTRELAIHDGLTGLYTKGYFLERLKEECKRNIRQGRDISLLMLDIDYFKNYNDEFGHTAGDIVLKNLSFNITGFFKDLDHIASRFGGEEFCVALLDKSKASARSLAEELRSKIEKTRIALRRQETKITVSIGVACLPVDASDEDELIQAADRAMYAAKKSGRNRVTNA